MDEFLARMRALQLQRRQKRRRAHRQSIHKKEEAVPVSMGVSPARTYWDTRVPGQEAACLALALL